MCCPKPMVSALANPHTRRAYQIDLRDFKSFTSITRPEDCRIVTRAHVLI
jgi:hypothetical protein